MNVYTINNLHYNEQSSVFYKVDLYRTIRPPIRFKVRSSLWYVASIRRFYVYSFCYISGTFCVSSVFVPKIWVRLFILV
jgi:hypothetical protein